MYYSGLFYYFAVIFKIFRSLNHLFDLRQDTVFSKPATKPAYFLKISPPIKRGKYRAPGYEYLTHDSAPPGSLNIISLSFFLILAVLSFVYCCL